MSLVCHSRLLGSYCLGLAGTCLSPGAASPDLAPFPLVLLMTPSASVASAAIVGVQDSLPSWANIRPARAPNDQSLVVASSLTRIVAKYRFAGANLLLRCHLLGWHPAARPCRVRLFLPLPARRPTSPVADRQEPPLTRCGVQRFECDLFWPPPGVRSLPRLSLLEIR